VTRLTDVVTKRNLNLAGRLVRSSTFQAVEPNASTGRPVATSVKAIARYLAAVKELVERAGASRQLWIRQIGKVSQAIKEGDELAAVEAGVIGTDQAERFRKFREELNELHPPAACEACHMAVVGWIEKQIAACEVMVEIGETRNVELMRQTSGLLAEGRIDTARFKAEYNNLIGALQEHLKTHKPTTKPKRAKWPFGTRPRKAHRMGTL
jgi:hypothetical protein